MEKVSPCCEPIEPHMKVAAKQIEVPESDCSSDPNARGESWEIRERGGITCNPVKQRIPPSTNPGSDLFG